MVRRGWALPWGSLQHAGTLPVLLLLAGRLGEWSGLLARRGGATPESAHQIGKSHISLKLTAGKKGLTFKQLRNPFTVVLTFKRWGEAKWSCCRLHVDVVSLCCLSHLSEMETPCSQLPMPKLRSRSGLFLLCAIPNLSATV